MQRRVLLQGYRIHKNKAIKQITQGGLL